MARLYKTIGYEAQQTELEIQAHPHPNAFGGRAEAERDGRLGTILVINLVGVFLFAAACNVKRDGGQH